METLSTEAKYTLQFINQTHRSVFLTGKAGTGKTTLLQEIRSTTHKNTVVVAPTGIAALNAAGVTIHSLFQLPFHAFIPEVSLPETAAELRLESMTSLARHFKMSGQKKAVLRNMDLLIIDEVSMLRADLLDAIDFTLQMVRKNKQPFGGVQVLFIGDLLQLPPVVNDSEWYYLKRYYKGKYFFHAQVLQKHPPIYIELDKIYRQNDSQFIGILNNLRNNKVNPEDLLILNQYIDYQYNENKYPGYITLTTHNHKADQMNTQSLAQLTGQAQRYLPEITGEFPEKLYPIDPHLDLKVGAQIMFIKNDIGVAKQFYNGKMGQIKSLSTDEIVVFFPEESRSMVLEKHEWTNVKYTVDSFTKEVKEEVIGTFVHYPIKLAWAITIHKSQGLTFDKAVIDVSRVFMPGQAYVALSRLRSLSGLVLLAPLQMNGMVNDQDVMEYANHKLDENRLATSLAEESMRYVHAYLKTSFSWENLAQEWRNFTHEIAQSKSKKKTIQAWSANQLEKLLNLLEPAKKFSAQLDSLFAQSSPNYELIQARIAAAYGYFFPVLDELVAEILAQLEAVQALKKSKTLFDELLALEETQTNCVLQLHKATLLINAVAAGKTLNKNTLQSPFLQEYKSQKIAQILEKNQGNSHALIQVEASKKRYEKAKKSTTKEEKITTIQATYALWEQNLSVAQIAEKRKLSEQTIHGHFVNLIENQTISIESILPNDRIQKLAKAFENYTETSLQPLKERYGEAFSWDELKLFKASLVAHS